MALTDGKNRDPMIKFEMQQTAKKTCSCCGLLGCIVFQNGTQTAKLCGCQNEVIYFHWINFFFHLIKYFYSINCILPCYFCMC